LLIQKVYFQMTSIDCIIERIYQKIRIDEGNYFAR
jgi:hypothetical protein